ncbi:uncharacterized protein LOC129730817 [Wyeomyia smithii]|uniref:uncharacterized protein LOC129730817 n=1 Tax=Wyeomyia smithii TaxID=174621 RepID=UPI0024681A64|nr:uncharacterized protein LOC129730817 [Wyeomyia smithii]
MTEQNGDTSGEQNFTNTTSEYRSTTSESTILPYYELHVPPSLLKKSPSKIEFRLVPKATKPKRASTLHRNIYTRAQCSGSCGSSRPAVKEHQAKPNVRRSLKRVFFKFNQKCCPAAEPNCPQDDEVSPQFENMEIYYFDHGRPEFYRTTDCPPHLVTEALAQSTHHHATKFWAEIFGTINIGATFVISFWLQLYRFLLYGILRAIFVGFLQITADYLLKPLLAVMFNGLIQPPIVFVHNILTALGDMLEPVAKLLGSFIQPFSRLIGSLRFIENKTIHKKIIKKRRFDV